MAIFERDQSTTNTNKEYIGLFNQDGNLVAFISPVKNVPSEQLVEALKAKGLNVEVRETRSDSISVDL